MVAGVRHFRNHELRKKSMPTDEKAYENIRYIDPRTLPVSYTHLHPLSKNRFFSWKRDIRNGFIGGRPDADGNKNFRWNTPLDE